MAMAVRQSLHPAPEHLEALALPQQPRASLVLLPDALSSSDGQMVAGFRAGAQTLRVQATRASIPVEIVVPEGARPGRYSEHSADWVLPLVLGVPGTVVAQLIANEIQRRIDEWREQGRSHMATLRYREVLVDGTTQAMAVREIEGPADEVADLVLRRAETAGIKDVE